MARGKPTPPRRPAAVSPPGRLSARTDGGPGQPIRAPSGGKYGERKALEDAQRAVPLASAPSVSGPAPAATAAAPPAPPMGAFGPTARPAENPLAGLGAEQRALQADPDEFIRVLYQMYPHPDIARLIDPYRGSP